MATKKYVSLEKLGLYDEKIKKVITDGDASALASAKSYADGLATNYDAAGSAASALADAKSYADGKDGAIAEAKQAGVDAAAAAAVADGKAVAAQGEVDALEAYVGTFAHDTAKTVVEYINAKTDGIATSGNLEALGVRVTTVEGKVATIEGDYLKASDKTEIEGKITNVQTAVDTEKSRAEGIESGLRTDVDAIKEDYLKAADKTELQGNIDTLTGVVNTLRDGVDAEKVDGVKDLIDYVEEHGTEVTGMKEDISENAAAIEGVAGRMTTAEGKITAVEGAVATKAEKTYVDEQVQALQGVDTGLDNRLKAVEAAVGESGSVADDIATAKQEAIDAAAADATSKANAAEAAAKGHADGLNTAMNTRVEALESASATHALASDLTALTGRVTTAEGEIDTLQSEMDAVEAKALANETNVAKKADKATTLAGYGITDAYTTAQVDTAISNAIGQFEECSEADINAMFQA